MSKIEVQKLAYFLQEAGENLQLNFVKHKYGPYADALRHALDKMDGHFIHGVGDGVVDAEIEPMQDAVKEAESFILKAGNLQLSDHIKRVEQLIDGFQSSYGMELLATMHWVATHENARSVEDVNKAIAKWNKRKREIMKPEHVQVVWDRLRSQEWLHA